MPDQPNFLLGADQRLTETVVVKKPGGPKNPPYSFEESKARLAPRAKRVASALRALPAAACPDEMAVAAVTIHPDYLAKSYFPAQLFAELQLIPVGSHAVSVAPERWSRKNPPKSALTSEVFVAGARVTFDMIAREMPLWTVSREAFAELVEIEDFRPPDPADRVSPVSKDHEKPLLEIVLHSLGADDFIVQRFFEYLEYLGVPREVKQRRFSAQGLCFLGLYAPRDRVADIARFSFLRVAREMPSLRTFRPAVAITRSTIGLTCPLPAAGPIDASVRVAVFDGGLPAQPDLGSWVKLSDPPGVSASVPDAEEHGLQVTSAVLFGPLTPGVVAPRPFSYVDHYRVIDDKTNANTDLFDVLGRILDVLKTGKHAFANLSVGPDMPIDDDHPHVWTTTLDEVLSSGKALVTVAVGNSGEADATSGLNRIQPPSDCVNALSVGACDTQGTGWTRAAYSSVGPGRSPGLIKPELLLFGGSNAEPFIALKPGPGSRVAATAGTSFAAPSALRLGLGIRAHFGDVFSPLALKAIVLHHCEIEAHSPAEVGHGRPPSDIEDLVVCGKGVATVVYQGVLAPRQFLRVPIPWPKGEIEGMVAISATICIATKTDPAHPIHYTRAGLEVVFRPHSERFRIDKKTGRKSLHPKSDTFFSSNDGTPETELRSDEHKWETTQQRTISKRGDSLKDPVLDIHHIPRSGGQDASSADPVPYAVVLTLVAPKAPRIYDGIVARYRGLVIPVQPRIAIPIRTRS